MSQTNPRVWRSPRIATLLCVCILVGGALAAGPGTSHGPVRPRSEDLDPLPHPDELLMAARGTAETGNLALPGVDIWKPFFESLGNSTNLCVNLKNSYVTLCPNKLLGDFCPDLQGAYKNKCYYTQEYTETYAKAIVYSGALVLSLVIGSLLMRFKFYYLPESGVSILIGLAVGAILLAMKEPAAVSILQSLFFAVLLPPLIFEAGLMIDKKLLKDHVLPILMYAIVGTILATLITALVVWAGTKLLCDNPMPVVESLLFASLISSTDPIASLSLFDSLHVDRKLYILAFGEAMFNDGISVTLYSTFLSLVGKDITMAVVWKTVGMVVLAIGVSVIIGSLFGLVAWAFYRWVGLGTHPAVEGAALLFFSMLPYFICQILEFSGIVAIIVEAFIVDLYVLDLMTQSGRDQFIAVVGAVARVFEATIFVYLGIELLVGSYTWNAAYIFTALFGCLLARALIIFPLSAPFHCTKQKIAVNHQVMLWFSGLRGAVSFTLAVNVPAYDPVTDTGSHYSKEILAMTTTIILLSIFLCGGGTYPVLRLLKIDRGTAPEPEHGGSTYTRLPAE